jgi:hypothetical protein
MFLMFRHSAPRPALVSTASSLAALALVATTTFAGSWAASAAVQPARRGGPRAPVAATVDGIVRAAMAKHDTPG